MSPEIELSEAIEVQGNAGAGAGARYVNDCLMQEDISGSINSAKLMYLINRLEEKRSIKIANWAQKNLLGDLNQNFNVMAMLIGMPVTLILMILGGLAFYDRMNFEGFGVLTLLSMIGGGALGGFGSLLSIAYVSEMSEYVSESKVKALTEAIENDVGISFDDDGNNTPDSFEKILSVLEMLDENVYVKQCEAYKDSEKQKEQMREKLEKNLSFMSYYRARTLLDLDLELTTRFRQTVKERGFSGELARNYLKHSLRRVVLGDFLMGKRVEVKGINEKIEHLL